MLVMDLTYRLILSDGSLTLERGHPMRHAEPAGPLQPDERPSNPTAERQGDIDQDASRRI